MFHSHAKPADGAIDFGIGQQGTKQRSVTRARPKIVMVEECDEFSGCGGKTDVASG